MSRPRAIQTFDRFGKEMTAAILALHHGLSRTAGFYFKRAAKASRQPAVQSWCVWKAVTCQLVAAHPRRPRGRQRKAATS